jgi:hypothetical protein
MRKWAKGSVFLIVVCAMSAAAQTNTFPASGNVGIGTTSPAQNLEVGGNVQVDGTLYGDYFASGTSDAAYIQLADPNGGMNFFTYWGIGWPTQGYFKFYTASATTPAMSILSNGNVGIGTPNLAVPRTNLDIVGSNTTLDIDSSTGNSGTVGIQLLHVGGNTNQQKVAILSDATGSWGGGNLRFAVNIDSDLSNVSTSDTKMFISGTNGNVGIGTTSPGAPLEVNGSVKLTAGSGAAITFQDGTTQSTAYTGVLCGGDYAESVDVTGARRSYTAGDVLVIDPNDSGKFLKSAEPYSTAVLGIYSTKPGAVGRRQLTPKSADEVPMAMIGIVPTKVSAENGPIKPGDLLVTSSTPGYAMKGTDRSRLVGAIIGKAMGRLESGQGVIEVGVTLQ